MRQIDYSRHPGEAELFVMTQNFSLEQLAGSTGNDFLIDFFTRLLQRFFTGEYGAGVYDDIFFHAFKDARIASDHYHRYAVKAGWCVNACHSSAGCSSKIANY